MIYEHAAIKYGLPLYLQDGGTLQMAHLRMELFYAKTQEPLPRKLNTTLGTLQYVIAHGIPLCMGYDIFDHPNEPLINAVQRVTSTLKTRMPCSVIENNTITEVVATPQQCTKNTLFVDYEESSGFLSQGVGKRYTNPTLEIKSIKRTFARSLVSSETPLFDGKVYTIVRIVNAVEVPGDIRITLKCAVSYANSATTFSSTNIVYASKLVFYSMANKQLITNRMYVTTLIDTNPPPASANPVKKQGRAIVIKNPLIPYVYTNTEFKILSDSIESVDGLFTDPCMAVQYTSFGEIHMYDCSRYSGTPQGQSFGEMYIKSSQFIYPRLLSIPDDILTATYNAINNGNPLILRAISSNSNKRIAFASLFSDPGNKDMYDGFQRCTQVSQGVKGVYKPVSCSLLGTERRINGKEMFLEPVALNLLKFDSTLNDVPHKIFHDGKFYMVQTCDSFVYSPSNITVEYGTDGTADDFITTPTLAPGRIQTSVTGPSIIAFYTVRIDGRIPCKYCIQWPSVMTWRGETVWKYTYEQPPCVGIMKRLATPGNTWKTYTWKFIDEFLAAVPKFEASRMYEIFAAYCEMTYSPLGVISALCTLGERSMPDKMEFFKTLREIAFWTCYERLDCKVPLDYTCTPTDNEIARSLPTYVIHRHKDSFATDVQPSIPAESTRTFDETVVIKTTVNIEITGQLSYSNVTVTPVDTPTGVYKFEGVSSTDTIRYMYNNKDITTLYNDTNWRLYGILAFRLTRTMNHKLIDLGPVSHPIFPVKYTVNSVDVTAVSRLFYVTLAINFTENIGPYPDDYMRDYVKLLMKLTDRFEEIRQQFYVPETNASGFDINVKENLHEYCGYSDTYTNTFTDTKRTQLFEGSRNFMSVPGGGGDVYNLGYESAALENVDISVMRVICDVNHTVNTKYDKYINVAISAAKDIEYTLDSLLNFENYILSLKATSTTPVLHARYVTVDASGNFRLNVNSQLDAIYHAFRTLDALKIYHTTSSTTCTFGAAKVMQNMPVINANDVHADLINFAASPPIIATPEFDTVFSAETPVIDRTLPWLESTRKLHEYFKLQNIRNYYESTALPYDSVPTTQEPTNTKPADRIQIRTFIYDFMYRYRHDYMGYDMGGPLRPGMLDNYTHCSELPFTVGNSFYTAYIAEIQNPPPKLVSLNYGHSVRFNRITCINLIIAYENLLRAASLFLDDVDKMLSSTQDALNTIMPVSGGCSELVILEAHFSRLLAGKRYADYARGWIDKALSVANTANTDLFTRATNDETYYKYAHNGMNLAMALTSLIEYLKTGHCAEARLITFEPIFVNTQDFGNIKIGPSRYEFVYPTLVGVSEQLNYRICLNSQRIPPKCYAFTSIEYPLKLYYPSIGTPSSSLTSSENAAPNSVKSGIAAENSYFDPIPKLETLNNILKQYIITGTVGLAFGWYNLNRSFREHYSLYETTGYTVYDHTSARNSLRNIINAEQFTSYPKPGTYTENSAVPPSITFQTSPNGTYTDIATVSANGVTKIGTPLPDENALLAQLDRSIKESWKRTHMYFLLKSGLRAPGERASIYGRLDPFTEVNVYTPGGACVCTDTRHGFIQPWKYVVSLYNGTVAYHTPTNSDVDVQGFNGLRKIDGFNIEEPDMFGLLCFSYENVLNNIVSTADTYAPTS